MNNVIDRTNRSPLLLVVLALVVSAMALLPIQAYASSNVVVEDANGSVIEEFAVSGTDITSALHKALYVGKSSEGYTETVVKVPSGSYTIDSGTNLKIFSNTKIVMPARTFITMTGKESALTYNHLMFQGAHYESDGSLCNTSKCKHGGYTQVKNIVIQGGVLDGNCAKHSTWNVTGVLLQHAQNLSITGTTFRNFTNHALNVAGSKDVTVTNCSFKNAIKYTGESEKFWGKQEHTAQGLIDRIRSTESVHTDFTGSVSEKTAYPLDNSPCENVTVKNCTFSKTYSGVGTHHINEYSKLKNIIVQDCDFTLKDGNAVNLFSCASATVTGNTVEGGYSLIRADHAVVTVSNNTASNCTGNAISGVKSAKVTVTGNRVVKSAAAGIMISDKASGTIKNNKITCTSKSTGINVSKGKATVSGNTVKGGAIGIALKAPSGACTVSSNKVNKTKGNGIYVYKATKGKIKVANNAVTTATAASIRIDKSKNVTVSKNTATDARFSVSASASSKLNITGNKFSGGDTVIRIVQKCKSVKVTKNVLKKKGKLCKSNAIYFFNQCTGSISGNTIVKAGTNGIRIDKKCKVKVGANTIKSPGKNEVSIAK